MDPLLEWFDLQRAVLPLGPASDDGLSLAHQALLYATVVAGVVLSEAVAMARAGATIRIELSRPWLAVACVVALVVFPVVWRQVGTLGEAALLVQMGVAAQGGVFWGVILAGAEKSVGAGPASTAAGPKSEAAVAETETPGHRAR